VRLVAGVRSAAGVRSGCGRWLGGRLNIGHLTDVSHCKLQQNFSCNRLHQRAG
jgi:hypothetical protein